MKRMGAIVMAGGLMIASARSPKVNDPADVQAIKDLMDGCPE